MRRKLLARLSAVSDAPTRGTIGGGDAAKCRASAGGIGRAATGGASGKAYGKGQ